MAALVPFAVFGTMLVRYVMLAFPQQVQAASKCLDQFSVFPDLVDMEWPVTVNAKLTGILSVVRVGDNLI